jgi:hypothetical protein
MKSQKDQYEEIIHTIRGVREVINTLETQVFFVSAHYSSPQWVRLSHILKQCSNGLAEWLKDNEDQEPK